MLPNNDHLSTFLPPNKVTTKYLNMEEGKRKGEKGEITAVRYQQEKSSGVLCDHLEVKE